MNKTITILIGIIFLSCSLKAQEMKIAFVNSEKIMTEYIDAQKIKEDLEQYNKEQEKEANEMILEITKLEKEYEEFNVLISKEKRLNKREEIQIKKEKLLFFKEKIWGSDGTFFKKNKSLNKPILKKINKVIAEFCEKEKYDIILDATTGALIYGKPEYDATDDIIDLLNKKD